MYGYLAIAIYVALSTALFLLAIFAYMVADIIKQDKRMEAYYDAANSEYRIMPRDLYMEEAQEEIAAMLEEVGGY